MEPLESTSPVDLTKAYLEGFTSLSHVYLFYDLPVATRINEEDYFLLSELQNTEKTPQDQAAKTDGVC